ncbi:tRNA splicing endonuclease subunit sen2 [Mortierella sp. AD094]|nr:tRNA splicing endonuclease subunit sen2 [Mortierella sp. AD094]
MSLEEITRQRRIERAQLKLKKTGQHKPDQGQTITSNTTTPSATTSSTAPSTSNPTSNSLDSAPASIPTNPAAAIVSPKSGTQIIDEEENYEHLQLSLEEAFFLVFAIECIFITDAAATAKSTPAKESSKARASMSIQSCWLRFAEVSALQQPKFVSHLTPSSAFEISASNPFIVRYVVYHYYRSQGWIVKDGLKYGTDFLLYQKGLVFGHSQYAVQVAPFNNNNNAESSPLYTTFKHVSISPTPGLCSQHQALSWQWLLTLNRVIAQVQKTVILCHVELPDTATKRQLSHPRTALPLYKVAEIGVKRFIPERNRA